LWKTWNLRIIRSQFGARLLRGDEAAMATAPLLGNPSHWRKRADQALATADQLTDPAAKAMMLDVVTGYEKLAQRAEQHRRGQSATRSPQPPTWPSNCPGLTLAR